MDFEKNIKELKKVIDGEKKMDLSKDQDLALGVMNLISIEEHFIFTGVKTGKEDYYGLAGEVRAIRKELLKKLVKDYEGEVWCISKHLLAGSMRLIEVGNKEMDVENKDEACKMFEKSYELFSLFWLVNKKVKAPNSRLKREEKNEKENKEGFLIKLKGIVTEMVDCCRE